MSKKIIQVDSKFIRLEISPDGSQNRYDAKSMIITPKEGELQSLYKHLVQQYPDDQRYTIKKILSVIQLEFEGEDDPITTYDTIVDYVQTLSNVEYVTGNRLFDVV